MKAPRFRRLCPHYRPCPTSLCYCEHRPTLSTTEIQDGGNQTGSGNNFWTVSDGVAISTSTPMFSSMAYSYMTISTLSDIARHCQTLTDYRKSRWRPPKPEMEIQIERIEPATWFQRLAPHLRLCRTGQWHWRCWPTFASYRNLRWRPLLPVSMAAIFNFGSRPTSDKVDRVKSMSGMVENMG